MRGAYDYLTVATTPASPPTPSLSYCSTAPTSPSASPRSPNAKMVRSRAVNAGTVDGARAPFQDEYYVLKSFNSHVKRCDECHNNLHSGRTDRPLCSEGYGLYVDMGPYFFCSNGKPYSSVEREKYGEYNRVQVPREMIHVTALFDSLDRGYSPKTARHTSARPKPIIVQPQPELVRSPSVKTPKTVRFSRFDEADVVVVPADRRRQRERERYYEERRQKTTTEKPYVVQQREPLRRGSLYHEDERRRHRHGEQVVIVPADQVYYRL